jgi:hypothetical protein
MEKCKPGPAELLGQHGDVQPVEGEPAQIRIADEIEEALGPLAELRLAAQHLVGDAVDGAGFRRDFEAGVEPLAEFLGASVGMDFDHPDLNDPIQLQKESCGFQIEENDGPRER